MSASHLALLRQHRERIQQMLEDINRCHGVEPTEVLFVIADIRGEFGAAWMNVIGRENTPMDFREFEAAREGLSVCISLRYEGGVHLIATLAPSLLPQIVGRPKGTVAMLVVDAADDPRVVIGRIVSPYAC